MKSLGKELDTTGFYQSQKTGFWYRIDDLVGKRYSIIVCCNCKRREIRKYKPSVKWRTCSSTCAIEYRAVEREERPTMPLRLWRDSNSS